MEPGGGGLWQTAAVVALVLLVSGVGYAVRVSALQADAAAPAAVSVAGQPSTRGGSVHAPASPLGDLSSFRSITQDTLDLLSTGDQAGATARIADLETEWDKAQARLKTRDSAAWTGIDGKIDTVLPAEGFEPEPDHRDRGTQETACRTRMTTATNVCTVSRGDPRRRSGLSAAACERRVIHDRATAPSASQCEAGADCAGGRMLRRAVRLWRAARQPVQWAGTITLGCSASRSSSTCGISGSNVAPLRWKPPITAYSGRSPVSLRA